MTVAQKIFYSGQRLVSYAQDNNRKAYMYLCTSSIIPV
jgi:hypothetical protein